MLLNYVIGHHQWTLDKCFSKYMAFHCQMNDFRKHPKIQRLVSYSQLANFQHIDKNLEVI